MSEAIQTKNGVVHDAITFDLTKATVEQIAPLIDRVRGGEMEAQQRIIRMLCTSIPDTDEAWDIPMLGEEFGRIFQAFNRERQRVGDSAKAEKLDVTFALDSMTAVQFDEYRKKLMSGNWQQQIEALCSVVKSCPWGDPKNPQTYKHLSYYTVYDVLLNTAAQASADAITNFQKRFS